MTDQKSNKVLIITGPTATGKTALADKLAEKFDGELISADSRQVYKGLDIVTGKDRPKNPIHGLDLVEPGQEWNAALFQDFAQKTIKNILKRKKLPLIVGGTGLYIKSLLMPFDIKVAPDPKLREQLEKLTLQELKQKLQKLDSQVFNRMNHSDQNNPRRLVRALEISMSRHPESSVTPTAPLVISSVVEKSLLDNQNLDVLVIGLSAPLDDLERRIKARVIKRLDQNPHQELEYLKSLAPNWHSSPATSLGYQELDQYYQGKISKEELINLWTTHERQYAKKQFTWFKKQPDLHWIDIRDKNYQTNVVDLVSAWYTESNSHSEFTKNLAKHG